VSATTECLFFHYSIIPKAKDTSSTIKCY